jgi:glycine oxidase
MRAAGLSAELLSPAEARRLEPHLGAHAAALSLPDEAQVDPPLLTRALQLAAARAGAEFASAYVRRIRHDGERVSAVEIEGDPIAAELVIVAAGSWSGLVDGAGLPPRAVRPMRGQMVELETRPAPFQRVLFFHAEAAPRGTGLAAAREEPQAAPGGYLVARADGRICVGSTMESVGFRKEVTAAGLASLLALAQHAVPHLADAPVRRFWAGFRPVTDDRLPFLGPTPIRGLHLATGHFRNGILLAPITADAVAAAACGEAPPIDLAPFAVTRLG